MIKKGMNFLKKHPAYNASIHALGGLGVGMIIMSYVSVPHAVLIGVILIVLSIIGHLYAFFA